MSDIVERLRIRIHTSEDETALTNEAADEIERLREALKGMVDNACAACDENYVIHCTKKEWDNHVKATAKARAALKETK